MRKPGENPFSSRLGSTLRKDKTFSSYQSMGSTFERTYGNRTASATIIRTSSKRRKLSEEEEGGGQLSRAITTRSTTSMYFAQPNGEAI